MKISRNKYIIISITILFLLIMNLAPFADGQNRISKLKLIGAGGGWLFSIHTKDICGNKNLKFTLTWKLFNKFKLESTYLYLWEKIQCFEPEYYSEFMTHGLLFNLKFHIKEDILYGAGIGLFLANYTHPLIDTTHLRFTPGIYIKLEFLNYIMEALRFELMYLMIPLDLRDYSYNKFTFMHIFTISIEPYGEDRSNENE